MHPKEDEQEKNSCVPFSSPFQFVNNEGIRIDKIVENLRDHFTGGADAGVLAELGI